MDEPVDHRRGDDLVAEDLAPGRERLVRGDDHAGALVAGGDEAEHQVRGLGVERDVADFVDDDRAGRSRAGAALSRGCRVRLASPSLATHSVAVAKATLWPARQARIAERDREVGLAGPGRAEQHDVLARVEEVELAEVLDHLALDRALEAEVELLERLAGGEAGGLDPALAAVALPARRPRSRAAPRRSARSPTPPRGPARPASAARGRPPAPSAPGTGARARRPWSCRDQRVVAGERAQFDLGLATSLAAQALEL